MNKIAIFVCGLFVLLIIGGCSTTSTTYSEQSFVGTWTGTDTGTNATVSVNIALANPAAPNGVTTATVNISVPSTSAPGGTFTTTVPVSVPRFQIEPTDYYFYAGPGDNYNGGQAVFIQAGEGYTFTIYINPVSTSGALDFQFSVMEPDQTTTLIGPVGITLTRTSST
jgi:hypothetical protein